MKRKFNFGRLGALALALTLITTSLMGGTLAKYTTQAAGTGTATVAKWAVVLKANNEEKKADFNFNLTDTGANKGNVKTDKIAPGSTGSIPVEINADGSEVAATLSYKIDTSGLNGVPIKFYSDADYSTEIKNETKKEIAAGATGDAAKLSETIYWKWDSTQGDAADTTVGEKTNTGTIVVTLKAEQKIETGTPAP